MPGKREEDFLKKYSNFTLFIPKLPPLWVPWGSWNLQFLVSLPYRCYIQNLVKIGPVVLEKKMLTHNERWTTHYDGRQPIAIKNAYFDINFIHIIKNIFKTFETLLKVQISLMLFNSFKCIHIMSILYSILTLDLMYNIMIIIEIKDILILFKKIKHFTLVFGTF